VHLSEPFKQTLGAIADRYGDWAEHRLDRRWQVVEMSATPSSSATVSFRLGSEDREDPKLKIRLQATKPIRLLEPIKVTGAEAARSRKFAEAVASEALVEGKPVPGKAVGVVVNRVRTARSVFSLLSERCGDQATVLLLTGRMRPADREKIQAEISERVGAGRPDRTSNARATIVVATQCVEAGADLDFDILVSECASWDALKQRFGRLNRLGDVQECRGTVLIRSDQVDAPDAVYGESLAKTWAWLRGRSEAMDVGLSGALASEPCPPECLPERAEAPLMLPAHLDSWCQTNPVPEPDPEVALWLHGQRRESAEVQIVWRADLSEEELRGAAGDRADALKERLSLFPPSAGEALSVPLHAIRDWLSQKGSEASDFPDVPFVEDARDDEADESMRPALRWSGDDSQILLRPADIRPGDTLVVPARYGGLTASNWDPESDEPIRDVGDRVAALHRRLPYLRLLPEVLRSDFDGEAPSAPQGRVLDEAEADLDDIVDAWLDEARSAKGEANKNWLTEALNDLRRKSRRKIVWVEHEWVNGEGTRMPGYYAVIARRRTDATTEDDASSFSGVAVPLDEHLEGVATWAGTLAMGAGLPPELVSAIEFAARWHDVGKADPRFQRLLHGGDAFKHALAPSLLAKSGAPVGDLRSRREAALRSGYPRGTRHELMSVALMTAAPAQVSVPPGVDRDLVLHLVASHHGYCRPLAPVAPDPEPRDVEYRGALGVLRAPSDHRLAAFDSGVSARFFLLVRRYGWFGLAWMEAILRLSDHRRSEAEQNAGGAT
jgi:CRISPR-associated endonuclease/helicase Cas3